MWPKGFVSGPDDRQALVVLLGLGSISPRRLVELAQRHGSARSCLKAVRAGRGGSESDRELAKRTNGAAVLQRLLASGARLIAPSDQEYPAELEDLFDPPAGLFARGRSILDLGPRVAIVGARNCSAAGREVAELLGAALARVGACVVSGGARGIDAAAHRGALRVGGSTIAVLGCGIDRAYPSENRRLQEQIAAAGAVVSEYPPGVPAMPFRFPARNRIIAALSRAVVVVEGAVGSGSMITADHALDIGREVFAVPGPVAGPLSAVPHSLIRDGATLIRGPEDLLADLGLGEDGGQPTASSPTAFPSNLELAGAERTVWEALTVASPPDSLATCTGLTLTEVISALVGLEVRRLVLNTGGRYERRPLGGGSS